VHLIRPASRQGQRPFLCRGSESLHFYCPAGRVEQPSVTKFAGFEPRTLQTGKFLAFGSFILPRPAGRTIRKVSLPGMPSEGAKFLT